MENNVRQWYIDTYPEDELGQEICPWTIFDDLTNEEIPDIYLHTFPDSIIRERIFEELAKRRGVDYTTIYKIWIS